MLSDQSLAVGMAGKDRRYLRVAQELLEEISSRRHNVGERLPTDRDLAVRFKVSRATVREALLVLEIIGVVETSLGAGVFVASFTPRLGGQGDFLLSSPADLIETRLAIEPLVAAMCAPRISPQALADLNRLVDQAEQLARDPAPFPTFLDLSLRFHALLAGHCGNAILGEIVTQLVDVNHHPLWVLLNQSVLRTAGDRLAEVQGHRLVLAALGRRDATGAEEAMANHLSHLRALIFHGPPTGETLSGRT
jgi:DNA-binding FadR family transcriptional regulator